MILTVFYYLVFLDIEFYNLVQCFYWYFGDIGGIGFKSGRQPRAAKIQPFIYLHQCSFHSRLS